MIGVLGHGSALERLYWAADNLANEMNFVVNHTHGAGSIARPVAQQSRALPLYHGCPFHSRNNYVYKKGCLVKQ